MKKLIFTFCMAIGLLSCTKKPIAILADGQHFVTTHDVIEPIPIWLLAENPLEWFRYSDTWVEELYDSSYPTPITFAAHLGGDTLYIPNSSTYYVCVIAKDGESMTRHQGNNVFGSMYWSTLLFYRKY
jgi:hypothetical protein